LGDEMPSLRVLAAAAVILIGTVPAIGQQNPPSDQAAPTDIGHTSTKGAEGPPQEVVKPSATINRADAIEEKKEAPNIIEVQPGALDSRRQFDQIHGAGRPPADPLDVRIQRSRTDN
jgi:hypothetical protein